jgi:hypothetical protein
MRRDVVKMQVDAVVEDGAAYGYADRTAEVAHHVEQPAGVFEPLGRQAAETEGYGRRHREDLREAAEYLRDQQLIGTPIMGDEAE